MILASNGVDFNVPGKNLKVSVDLNLSRSDLSGKSSQTSIANSGIKAKKVNVSLTIEIDNANDLRKLTTVAEAMNNGDPKVYTVADDLCIAMNIREVIFDGTLHVGEASNLQAWDVTFSLKEHRSPAEKKENREKAAEIAATDANGKAIKGNSSDSMLQNAINVSDKAVK